MSHKNLISYVSSDTHYSSRREKLIEHLFIGEILRSLWLKGHFEVDILRAETDVAGFDVIIEIGAITRHIQLKTSSTVARTPSQKINSALCTKPSGCVLWLRFDAQSMNLGPFLWFGGRPGEALPDISSYKIAKHSKGNANGVKLERKNIRVVPKGSFRKLDSIDEVIKELFGIGI